MKTVKIDEGTYDELPRIAKAYGISVRKLVGIVLSEYTDAVWQEELREARDDRPLKLTKGQEAEELKYFIRRQGMIEAEKGGK